LAGLVIAAVILRWPSVDAASPRAVGKAAQRVEHELLGRRGFRRFVYDRTNPAVATGLLLTAALAVVFLGGLVLGVLTLLVRKRSAGIVSIDHDISRWVNDHTTRFTHDTLQLITQLGGTVFVVVAALVVLVFEFRRMPNRWIAPFLAIVLIGQSLLTNGIKVLLDRARPMLNSTAHLLGPSFPSGHAATAAAFWAAVALLMGRGRGRRAQSALFGGAVAVGVAVACSRVLLDVHWVSDVLAGLALGWAWFGLCCIAFGGRLLRFGAPVEIAERAVASRSKIGSARNHAPSGRSSGRVPRQEGSGGTTGRPVDQRWSSRAV
jgi:membrane-associated phospholipid phosphatase